MHNFMTYGDVVFNASPRLNIIIGQNGSGKSTIACAVCLALGEDIKLLLRGNRLEEFIRYGEREARVKMFLKGETSVISVEVRIRQGVTDYYINNKPQKKEKLKELRRVLKIDLNNLCQFLPQDRVADFVSQTPQKRLREFEKSVGGESFVIFCSRDDS
ncbi:p-loop containing nucleoside triphosphate hydrolase protein [Blastocystis sp. subtype 4]|uniref:p-loop containing nucleoside triphosphate hydrolase protein n=1 Tax=Blastocystis sp. subtype 4 TaxID=944170 RepID=UPI000711D5A0|nr:p-loop containing nucleoside triphosphate hydrolase protein [Blastocystis sp. subtype 4]KNB42364.1 p-loop containing nucleoside triphosphate hydrolase protein [Blastocystis sp. subtype 4]|eukprot:XP_014525807.1 p-loop containing nucleoside triphosphate hydrolase protein [Blastocystis sp. subtype 4]